jgi:hypothetical protein
MFAKLVFFSFLQTSFGFFNRERTPKGLWNEGIRPKKIPCNSEYYRGSQKKQLF